MQGPQGPQGAPGTIGSTRGHRTVPFTSGTIGRSPVGVEIAFNESFWIAFDHNAPEPLAFTPAGAFSTCAMTVGDDGATLTAFSVYIDRWYAVSPLTGEAAPGFRVAVWHQKPGDASMTPLTDFAVVTPPGTAATPASAYLTPVVTPSPVDLPPGTRLSVGFTNEADTGVFILANGVAASIRI